MSNYPKYLDIDDVRYNINTDFRYAIEADRIARDTTIGDYERVLGIICTLFGTSAIDRPEHYEKLLRGAEKYLLCGEEKQDDSDKKQNMDFIKDEKYIKSSFKYDYNYNPYDLKYLHWYEFYNDLANLSNSEFGNCCILNRIINFRNIDPSEIKDPKERDKIIKGQKMIALNKEEHKRTFTEEEQSSMNDFYEQMERKE